MTDKIKEMYNNQLNAVVLNKNDLNNLISERNDWGYDALCLRYQELINEIVYLKTFSKEAKEKGHYGDYEYYKQFYSMRAVRFYQELDRFVGGLHDDKML